MWRWTTAAAGGGLIYCGVSGTRTASRLSAGNAIPSKTELAQTITIGTSADELFRLWRNTDVLSRVMHPFGEIDPFGPDHLRWTVDLPFGKFQSEALLVDERSNELVHWRTVPSVIPGHTPLPS